MNAAVDTSWNMGHILTLVGASAVIIGQWFVQGYRLNRLEKIASDNQGDIKRISDQAQKGPSLLCSLHEQRLTKLEEEMRVQFLAVKSDLELILRSLNVEHNTKRSSNE